MKKVKDSDYFERKASLARKKEEGKALMAEGQNWVYESDSDDDAHLGMLA